MMQVDRWRYTSRKQAQAGAYLGVDDTEERMC